jgi:outer membrane protein assembly factor BamB
MDRALLRRWLARLRHLLALALTFGVLPYGYGRWLVYFLHGVNDVRQARLVGATVAVLIPLTWGLRPPLQGLGTLLGWVVVNAGLLVWVAAPRMPLWQLEIVFIASTVWVLWLAWLGVWPLRWAARLGMLALWLALGALGPALIRVEGFTGDTTSATPSLVFAWREWTKPTYETAAGRAALTPTPDDFPRFLGPAGTGVLANVRIAGDWTATSPRERWRRPVGEGWGGFVVVGHYAFTQEQRGEQECVTCYRLDTGGPVWVHEDAARYDGIGGPGPRATPAFADGRLYAVGATGLLNCLDAATGRRLWSVNIQEDNGASKIEHGVCASPLVDGERVIVCPTGAGGPSLVAYHRETGSRLWQAGTDRASYASPMLATLGGVRQILLATNAGMTGHDAADGRVLWRAEWTSTEKINASQPIAGAAGPDTVLLSTGYGKGAALFGVRRGSQGWDVDGPRWTSLALKTKFTTPVLDRGYVYGLDDGILACVDPQTGKRRWKDGRYGHGQVLLAGDRLIVQAEGGAVVLVEPSPEGLRERGRIAALPGKTWNNPALAGRYLLVRNDREAACYELPGEPGA